MGMFEKTQHVLPNPYILSFRTLLTSWRKVTLEKLIAAQLVKVHYCVHKACHRTLS
jgi:hypothetical protein